MKFDSGMEKVWYNLDGWRAEMTIEEFERFLQGMRCKALSLKSHSTSRALRRFARIEVVWHFEMESFWEGLL